MAYVSDQDKDKQQQQGMDVLGEQAQIGQQPQLQPSEEVEAGQPISVTQQSGTIGQGAVGQASQAAKTATQPKKGVGSGMFTNIKQYIEANRPKAEQMAEGVVGGVEKQASDIRKQIQRGQERFQSVLKPEQQRIAGGEQFVKSAIEKAQDFVSDPSKMSQFEAIREGQGAFKTLTGPAFARAQERARALTEQTGGLGRPGDTRGLLRETVGGRDYTRGEQKLDELLLGRVEPARQRLETGAKEATSGLKGEAREARRSALEQLQQLRAGATDLAGRTAELLTGEEGAITTQLADIDKAVEAARRTASRRASGLQEALKKGVAIDRDTLRNFGLSNEEQLEFLKYYQHARPKTLEEKIKAGDQLTDQDIKLLGQGGSGNARFQKAYKRGDFRRSLLDTLGKQARAHDILTYRTGPAQMDLSSYVQALEDDAITRANVANPEEYARYQALARLANQQDLALRPEDMSRAGTADQLYGKLDAAAALSAMRDRFAQKTTQAAFGRVDPYSPSKAEKNMLKNILIAGGLGGITGAGLAGLMPEEAEAVRQAAKDVGDLGLQAINLPTDMLAKAIGGDIGRAVEKYNPVSAVRNVFCFLKGTPIAMADGTTKNVEDLDIFDEVLHGGKVTACGKGLADDVYKYKDILVTGSHAVFEDGEWKRVKDSKLGIEVADMEDTIVYPVATEEFLMISGETIFADYQEIEESFDFTQEEIIGILNANELRNKRLLEIEKDLKECTNGECKAV